MSSSTGLAHWTVELECDTLFIIEGCVAKDGGKLKGLGLTGLSKQGVRGGGGRNLSWSLETSIASRLDHTDSDVCGNRFPQEIEIQAVQGEEISRKATE